MRRRFSLTIGSLLCSLALAPSLGAGRAHADLKRCAPAGIQAVRVRYAPPAKTAVAGVKVRLDYVRDAVTIPGMMDDADVKRRVTTVPAGVLSVPNDEDSDLIVGMVSTTSIPAGPLFTVDFDRCEGATITLEQFHCTIEEASDEHAKLVDGATCAVELIDQKEGEK